MDLPQKSSLIPVYINSFDLDYVASCCIPNDYDDLEEALSKISTQVTPPAVNLNEPSSVQSHRNQKRAMKRKERCKTHGHIASHRTIFEHVQLSDAVGLQYNVSDMPVARGAFSGQLLRGSKVEKEKVYTLPELVELGFAIIEWDGIEPRPLVDCKGQIFGALAGRPGDPSYVRTMHDFFLKALATRETEPFSNSEQHHRRGDFVAIPFGISYGNGQTVPSRLRDGQHGDLIKDLLEDPGLHRMANYADSAFQLWAPRLYAHYQGCLKTVENATNTIRNFPGCTFACATFNFGPQVRTFKHRDSQNLPYGLCAIQSLGTFNPKAGGHLILWDLGLVIEFPPYSTILIPSACLTHSNTPVQSHEYCMSFTQYSAGGLFRWVSNSCMTEGELKSQNSVEYGLMIEMKSTRWTEALTLFSTYKELKACL